MREDVSASSLFLFLGSRLCGAPLSGAAPRPGHERARTAVCALAQCGQSRLSGRMPQKPPSEVLVPLESPSESPLDLPPDPPREPILTLPGALTAYIALIAVIQLRVLLPPELENWTID